MRRMTADEVIREFEAARKNGDIYAHFQPQYNHATGRMIGAEALMRWHHPVYGLQYPDILSSTILPAETPRRSTIG